MDFHIVAAIGLGTSIVGVLLNIRDRNYPAACWAGSSAFYAAALLTA